MPNAPRRQRRIPPFWWVWALVIPAIALALFLFLWRFLWPTISPQGPTG